MATKKNRITTADVFEFPAFDMTKVAGGYREMADKSVNSDQGSLCQGQDRCHRRRPPRRSKPRSETAQAGTC